MNRALFTQGRRWTYCFMLTCKAYLRQIYGRRWRSRTEEIAVISYRFPHNNLHITSVKCWVAITLLCGTPNIDRPLLTSYQHPQMDEVVACESRLPTEKESLARHGRFSRSRKSPGNVQFPFLGIVRAEVPDPAAQKVPTPDGGIPSNQMTSECENSWMFVYLGVEHGHLTRTSHRGK